MRGARHMLKPNNGAKFDVPISFGGDRVVVLLRIHRARNPTDRTAHSLIRAPRWHMLPRIRSSLKPLPPIFNLSAPRRGLVTFRSLVSHFDELEDLGAIGMRKRDGSRHQPSDNGSRRDAAATHAEHNLPGLQEMALRQR